MSCMNTGRVSSVCTCISLHFWGFVSIQCCEWCSSSTLAFSWSRSTSLQPPNCWWNCGCPAWQPIYRTTGHHLTPPIWAFEVNKWPSPCLCPSSIPPPLPLQRKWLVSRDEVVGDSRTIMSKTIHDSNKSNWIMALRPKPDLILSHGSSHWHDMWHIGFTIAPMKSTCFFIVVSSSHATLLICLLLLISSTWPG